MTEIRTPRFRWESEGFGLFAVELQASGELIGLTGLSVPRFLPEILPAGHPVPAVPVRRGSPPRGAA